MAQNLSDRVFQLEEGTLIVHRESKGKWQIIKRVGRVEYALAYHYTKAACFTWLKRRYPSLNTNLPRKSRVVSFNKAPRASRRKK